MKRTQARRHVGVAEGVSELNGQLGKRWFFFDGGSLSPVGQRVPASSGLVPQPQSPSTPSAPADPTQPEPDAGSPNPPDQIPTRKAQQNPQRDPQQDTKTVVSISSQDMRDAVPATKCRFQRKLDRLSDPGAQVAAVQINVRDLKTQQNGRIVPHA